MLWVSVLKSGVHATLAGVALAFMIPLEITDRQGKKHTPAKSFEDDLHVWAAFMILPLFAFVNAGIQLSEISIAEMLAPVPLGIMLGLFVGKQLGVFGFSWLAIRSGLAAMPEGSDWRQLYGVALLTGIGFTMSLFIDGLPLLTENCSLLPTEWRSSSVPCCPELPGICFCAAAALQGRATAAVNLSW